MTLDIIIPAYNCLSTIEKTLASISIQKIDSKDSIHVYIINDKSTNCSYEEIVDTWSRLLNITLINKEVNEGSGKARQTGVDNSFGEYFMFIDADDTLFSPFACRELIDMITSGDYDMGMGMFVEETPSKTYINHVENFTWCHGKIYKRKFIEESNIRFSELRFNEDVAYHAVIHAITDKVIFMPRLVYAWQNQDGSAVRKDVVGCALDYGFRDFIEAITIAIEDMTAKNICESKIVQFEASMLTKFYWNYVESKTYLPDKEKLNMKKLKNFYKRAMSIHPIDDGTMEYQFVNTTKEMDNPFIPDMTFVDFVRRISS